MAAGVPDLGFREAKSVDDNSRRMIAGEFDIAEMSLATFVRAVCNGADLVGLPVFPGRRFVHAGMLARGGSGLTGPRGLAGRRVAVPQYWLTSSVWHRGLLQESYDVAPEDIEWVTTQTERANASFPPGVQVTHVAGATVADLFTRGCVDAALMPRPITEELMAAGAENLFADVYVDAAQRDYFEHTGIFPVMHFVAMRRESLALAPQVPAALLAAFHTAHQARDRALRDLPPPVGLAANRVALERFLNYAREQQLVSSPPELALLFVSDTTNEHASA